MKTLVSQCIHTVLSELSVLAHTKNSSRLYQPNTVQDLTFLHGKCSKILNNFLFMLSNEILVIRTGITKCLSD